MLERLGQIRLAGIRLAQGAGCLAEPALERVARGAHVSKFGDEIGFAAGQALDVGLGGLKVAPHRVKRGPSALERGGCVAEAALERVARGAHVAKLRDEIGFATSQTLDVGARGLIVAPHRVKSRLSGFEPLFERRAI